MFYLTLLAVGWLFAESMHDERFKIMIPNYAIGGLTAPFFGIDLPPWLRNPWLLVWGLGLPVALMAVVWRRTRAIEVHT